MKERIQKKWDKKRVIYGDKRWEKLKSLRNRSIKVLEKIRELSPGLYGSVARGDVREDSDIDIIIPYKVPSYRLEVALDYERKKIIQATPRALIKGHLMMSNDLEIVFPLVEPEGNEMEFYRFGGYLSYEDLIEELNKRVPGVDKRLMFIKPLKNGHLEETVIGREGEVAKELGISVEMVNERVKVLRRREEVGRTGVYINKEISPDKSFEGALKKLSKHDPNVRGPS